MGWGALHACERGSALDIVEVKFAEGIPRAEEREKIEASELTERSWLVNRWGKKGRSIPTDLYLEHNNGFIKAS